MATNTLTGNVLQGQDGYDPDQIESWLESSEPWKPNGAGGIYHSGGGYPIVHDPTTGDFSVDVPVSTAGAPGYTFHSQVISRPGQRQPAPVRIGPFLMDVDKTLEEAAQDVYLPQAVTPEVVAQIEQAAAMGATNDTQVKSFVENPASATYGALSATFAPVIPAAENIFYVTPRGNDTNNGRSWSKAFATVKAALNAIGATTNARIELGWGNITETVAWGTIPQGTVINGCGKIGSTVKKAFNGTLVDLGQGAMLTNLTLDGQGATYTGRGVTCTGTRGGQTIADCQIINFDGECLWFAYTAGSGFKLNDSLVYRYNAPSGSGRYGIVIEDVEQLSAVPRKFDGLDSGGQATFHFGGSNDTFITNSFLNDIDYSTSHHSRGVLLTNCRLASPRALLDMRGSNNTIIGCDVYSQVVVKAGAGGNCVGPNAYNTLPPKDESGLNTNKIIHETFAFTPTFETATTATTIGNMSRAGFWSRSGSRIEATMDITVGSTTVMGTGEIRIGLPAARFNPDALVVGTAKIFPAGGSTQYVTTVEVVGAVAYIRLVRDTSGIATPTSPHAAGLAAGSNIRVTVSYRL